VFCSPEFVGPPDQCKRQVDNSQCVTGLAVLLGDVGYWAEPSITLSKGTGQQDSRASENKWASRAHSAEREIQGSRAHCAQRGRLAGHGRAARASVLSNGAQLMLPGACQMSQYATNTANYTAWQVG